MVYPSGGMLRGRGKEPSAAPPYKGDAPGKHHAEWKLQVQGSTHCGIPLIGMPGTGKPAWTERRPGVTRGWRCIANGYGGSSWGAENILELDSREDCTTL